jgi:hypothetical protein
MFSLSDLIDLIIDHSLIIDHFWTHLLIVPISHRNHSFLSYPHTLRALIEMGQ